MIISIKAIQCREFKNRPITLESVAELERRKVMRPNPGLGKKPSYTHLQKGLLPVTDARKIAAPIHKSETDLRTTMGSRHDSLP
jgi:hypothetical protein